MKHFQDENYDPMKEYEHSSMHHDDDYDPSDYEGSMVFRHWNEDDDHDDYDGSMVFRHWNED